MKHGCHDIERRAGYWANDGVAIGSSGWKTRLVHIQQKFIDDKMTLDCQYSKGVPDDPKCDGCEKKGKP